MRNVSFHCIIIVLHGAKNDTKWKRHKTVNGIVQTDITRQKPNRHITVSWLFLRRCERPSQCPERSDWNHRSVPKQAMLEKKTTKCTTSVLIMNRAASVMGQKRQRQRNSTYIALKPAYCSCSGTERYRQEPAYSLGRSPSSRTLVCSHTAKRSPCLPFNGLRPHNPCNDMDYCQFTDRGWAMEEKS